uniref:UPAR/Ly6 domain-containing protein n=1 Tax=Amphilophus citrinellus TaxID=61819 RepID=A0A3Q0RB60_AMPCI
MQLYGALILCVTLSAGMKIFHVGPVIFSSCLAGVTMVTKGCLNSLACISPITCCEGNLCNSAIPTGPSAILLLVSSAILKLLF